MQGSNIGYAATPQATAPTQPTRFSNCAGQLDARVSHMSGLVDRFSRVADRLGGSVPEPADPRGEKIRGQGSNVAAQIEQSIELFDEITRRAERVVERLESL